MRLQSVYEPVPVVSFRISDADEAVLSQAGRSPAELAKAAVQREARLLRAQASTAALRALARPARKPSAQLVRELREERDAGLGR